MDIDNEVLIALVFERASLWDKNNKFYSNRSRIDKSWKEISSEMKHDEYKLRKRWRYLRDQYAAELGKMPVSRWPYFKSLHFLKDVVKPRTRLVTGSSTHQKSLPPSPSQVTDQCPETAEIETRSSAHDSDISPSSSPRHQENDLESGQPSTFTPTIQEIKSLGSIDDQILHIKQQKLKLLQEEQKLRSQENQRNEDNEHFLFFKSLIPHVERIPQHLVLSFRNRIQSVVEEFAYTSVPNSSYLSADGFCTSSTPSNAVTPLDPLSIQSQENRNLAEMAEFSETKPMLNMSTQSEDNQNLAEMAEFYGSEAQPMPLNTASISKMSTQSQDNQNLAEMAEFYSSETKPPLLNTTSMPSMSNQSQDNQNLADLDIKIETEKYS